MMDERRGLWARLWQVASAVSVRTKILGMALALVLAPGLGVTVLVRATITRAMDAQLAEQAVAAGRDLAARATDLLLINDLYSLHQLLAETQANNTALRYAFVSDKHGQVVVHTFGAGFPPALLNANPLTDTTNHRLTVLSTDEGPVWDVAVPILEGRAGTARVGLSEVNVRRTVDQVTGQLLLTTVLVSAVSILAAAALTWLITHPIVQLAAHARAVAGGDLSRRLPRWANDEIGELTDEFNAMTAELAKAATARAERDQLRARYVNAVIAAQEEERKRIARELHDSASQSLTSLLVGLKALADQPNPAEARQLAADLRQVAVHTLDEVHALSHQLRPSVLDDLGLTAALRRYCADFQRRHNLPVDVALRGLDNDRLPPQVETALYRMVQEALTNVARHAHASAASVLIERRPHSVRAVVEDDGRGFDPHLPHQRLGLYGIRERAELLGGKLIIESSPGQGASLFIEIPLTAPGETMP